MPYELFISYSRHDNTPRRPGQSKGWVTALRDEILADHRRFSTEPLHIFLDEREIRSFDDWRNNILEGLRQSRILLVCLSPDYFKSPPCLWEWEEYLERQVHALMGQDSVAPVYFVEAPDGDEQMSAAWAEAVTRKAVSPADRPQWEKRWRDWRAAVDRHQWVDLKPWFPRGVEALREAAVREKLAALGTSLWERIQRARRATSAPGNLRRLNPHFIGRRTELRQLHENLALGAVGVVTAVHGLGGQGKTELATAYAHGWADCYPGGLWVLSAEGKKEILPLLGELTADLQIHVTADETADQRGRRVLAELKRRTLDVRERHPEKGAACLVILDNVSEPLLLAEPQLAQIPREDWLRVVVTTREGPEKFPASRQKSLTFIAVDALTTDDAARLVEDHQIATNGRWPAATAAADASAAREIARELGGFTLAVESVAIYLGLHPDIRPADYLARLRAEGLPSVDDLAASDDLAAAKIQHRDKQLRLVLDQTLARITPPERAALDYAALLPPDQVPWPWLRALVEEEYADELAARPGYPDPWPALQRRLEGLRLLTPGDRTEIARIHRLVLACLKRMLEAQDRDQVERHFRCFVEGLAIDVVQCGEEALRPYRMLRFGRWLCVDPAEGEGLARMQRRAETLLRTAEPLKPVSTVAFGPPGSGKSFALKELARSCGDRATTLEFNLTQFSSEHHLVSALHLVSAEIEKGMLPVVLWDEFDGISSWMGAFVKPVCRGYFESGRNHFDVRRAVFVFISACWRSWEEFGFVPPTGGWWPEATWRDVWEQVDGDTFRSGIDEHVNFHSLDSPFAGPIQLALHIRQFLGVSDDQRLDMDARIIRPLVMPRLYRHGLRSLNRVLSVIQEPFRSGQRITSEHLRKAAPLLDQHLRSEEFFQLLDAP